MPRGRERPLEAALTLEVVSRVGGALRALAVALLPWPSARAWPWPWRSRALAVRRASGGQGVAVGMAKGTWWWPRGRSQWWPSGHGGGQGDAVRGGQRDMVVAKGTWWWPRGHGRWWPRGHGVVLHLHQEGDEPWAGLGDPNPGDTMGPSCLGTCPSFCSPRAGRSLEVVETGRGRFSSGQRSPLRGCGSVFKIRLRSSQRMCARGK